MSFDYNQCFRGPMLPVSGPGIDVRVCPSGSELLLSQNEWILFMHGGVTHIAGKNVCTHGHRFPRSFVFTESQFVDVNKGLFWASNGMGIDSCGSKIFVVDNNSLYEGPKEITWSEIEKASNAINYDIEAQIRDENRLDELETMVYDLKHEIKKLEARILVARVEKIEFEARQASFIKNIQNSIGALKKTMEHFPMADSRSIMEKIKKAEQDSEALMLRRNERISKESVKPKNPEPSAPNLYNIPREIVTREYASLFLP